MSRCVKTKAFTSQERCLFLEILKDFKHKIENKNTDNVSAAVMKRTWAEIAERYNACAIVSESASGKQLSRLWTILKTRQRDDLTKERKYRLAPGGSIPCLDAENVQNFPLKISNSSNSTDTSASTNLSPITNESTRPSINSQSNVPPSMGQLNQPRSFTLYECSSHEKELRVQFLKREHINQERRADEIHAITLKYKKEIHELEVKILKEKLKEAKSRAGAVHKHL